MSFKNISVIFSASLMVLTSFSAFALNPLCPKAIKIGWEPYPPFQMEGALPGIDIELSQAVVKKVGCVPVLDQNSWKRQLFNLENGETDIVTSANKTPEREKYATFISPYMVGGNVMYMLKSEVDKYSFKFLKDVLDVTKFKNKDSFQNFKIGATRGYEYGDTYGELLKNNKEFASKVVEATSDNNLIDKTQQLRTNALLGDITVISYILKQTGRSDLFTVYPAKVDNESVLYFAYSKKSVKPELATQFNAALNTLLKDGTFNKILLKYITQDQIKIITLK